MTNMTKSLHICEDLLERYALNQLVEDEQAPVEEHLLVCNVCRNRLDGVDEYIRAMRLAVMQESVLQPGSSSDRLSYGAQLRGKPVFLWAATIAALFLVFALPWKKSITPPTEITLEARRGSGSLSVAHGHASSSSLVLNIDLTELATVDSYSAQVVDADGRQVWRGVLKPVGKHLVIVVPTPLSAGTYWVRLFDNSDPPAPLREYGFELE